VGVCDEAPKPATHPKKIELHKALKKIDLHKAFDITMAISNVLCKSCDSHRVFDMQLLLNKAVPDGSVSNIRG